MKNTILLIDDCEMMRRFLAPIFKDNFQVIALKNPMEAILWLKTNPIPDAILLDYELPEMTGIELLKHLRQNNQWAGIPVLMLSGVKDTERRWQCIEAGANDFLAKPFHPKELALRVNLISKPTAHFAQANA
ncbi:MAG: response regulator [Saprospiraceae bacterium]|nr:response regulator [Saprospiraceae bacterium]